MSLNIPVPLPTPPLYNISRCTCLRKRRGPDHTIMCGKQSDQATHTPTTLLTDSHSSAAPKQYTYASTGGMHRQINSEQSMCCSPKGAAGNSGRRNFFFGKLAMLPIQDSLAAIMGLFPTTTQHIQWYKNTGRLRHPLGDKADSFPKFRGNKMRGPLPGHEVCRVM